MLFALTLVCLKLHILHSQRAFIVCDTFPKILSRLSVRVFYMKYISLRFDQTHRCDDTADESIKEKKDDSRSLFSNINLLKKGAFTLELYVWSPFHLSSEMEKPEKVYDAKSVNQWFNL